MRQRHRTILVTIATAVTVSVAPLVTATAPASAVSSTTTAGAVTAPHPTASGDSARVLGNGLDMSWAEAKSTVNTLPIKPPLSMTGYDQNSFPHWLDASTWGWPVEPSNACDARDATLYRDGTDVEVDNHTCAIGPGTWLDPYTAETFTDAGDLDIDHFVPRANAWRSGAKNWTDEERRGFANASLELVISSASANRSKGDKGPEAWQPANTAASCLYATRWVAIKDTYELNLTSTDEKTALTDMLDTCE